MRTFGELLRTSIAQNQLHPYVYSYPSKRTYKPLNGISLNDMWNEVETTDISIYIHVPFCGYRCTYCTLFLTTHHSIDLINSYVEKLCSQMWHYKKYAAQKRVSSIYIGGGTPSILNSSQFDTIFSTLRAVFEDIPSTTEICVEGSPDSLTPELLDGLLLNGVNRISMGIQTMDARELKASGRPYSIDTTVRAIDNIFSRFENFNLDLIYGLSGQHQGSWAESLEYIAGRRPMTVSLYPVVSRPLTAIQRQMSVFPDRYITDEEKLAIYDWNVQYMLDRGYRQESFTRFTRLCNDKNAYEQEISDFQGTPMIGIGAGARSNVGRYHYSFGYAVDLKKVNKAIEDFLDLPLNDYTMAQYGAILSDKEERLRYFLLSLTVNKLSKEYYALCFGRELYSDYSEILQALLEEECIEIDEGSKICLTPKGFKFSNLIAHLLFSNRVNELEEGYIPQ